MPRVKHISSRELPTDLDSLVRILPPTALHDEVDYENVREMIDALTALPKPTKGQSRYLETLSILFEAYENEHHQIDVEGLSGTDVVRHLLKENGMSASELGRLLGERSLGPKILNGDRELSKAHIRKLAEHFGISPAVFL
jgi:antitoxin component HigA of HigAB toxin-antitoxin module